MSDTVIKIENLSKIYRLGEVGTGTLSHDLNRWWKMNVLRREDPYAKIGHVNDRTQKAEKGELIAALRDINLEVKQGEVLGIIGKNGAGKSTLLKLLSRVTSPTTGTIKTKGRLASLLEVGTGFHPEMTGRENIYMNGTIMGMRKWEISRKLDEIVDFAGVAKYMDTPVKRYSSGMTVRLGFAVAAFLEPEILIVDEVLAVGDAEFQKKAIGKMQDVSKGGGRTVLFVSHNMGIIQSICNRAIILENGAKVFENETNSAIRQYLSANKNELKNLTKGFKEDTIISYKSFQVIQNGIESHEISSHQEFEINISFELKEDVHHFRIYIDIYNSNGFLLFKSFFDEPNDWGSSLKAGVYNSIARLPANTLIADDYQLKIFSDIRGLDRLLEPKDGIAIPFSVIETGEIYRNRLPTTMRGLLTIPNVVWRTENPPCL